MGSTAISREVGDRCILSPGPVEWQRAISWALVNWGQKGSNKMISIQARCYGGRGVSECIESESNLSRTLYLSHTCLNSIRIVQHRLGSLRVQYILAWTRSVRLGQLSSPALNRSRCRSTEFSLGVMA